MGSIGAPLEPWVNKIISNQMKNILRNYYSNFVRPCVNCPFNRGDDSCGFTESGLQTSECPLYKKWEKTKKSAFNIKMAVTLESEAPAVLRLSSSNFDLDHAEKKLHKEMEKDITGETILIYIVFYLLKTKKKKKWRKILGYKSNEKGRKAGYKQIKNLKKKFKNIAITLIEKRDICP